MAKAQKTLASSTRRTDNRNRAESFGSGLRPDLTVGRQGLPTDVYIPSTPEEYQFIGTVLANGWKAGKSVLEYYRKADIRTALAVSVVRSEPTTKGYRVDFQFANVSPHSIYIEDLLILDPDADAYQIRLVTFTLEDSAALDKSSPGSSMSFAESTPGNAGGSAGSSVRSLPMLIKRGENPTLSLLIARDAKLWFDEGRMGIARAKVSFLGEETPQSVAWRFLIRNK